VRQGLFGLASGSAWDAEDSVLRFGESVDPSEIHFQSGTWLVHAGVIKELIAARKPLQPPIPGTVAEPVQVPAPGDGGNVPAETTGVKERPATSTTLPSVTLHIRGIPGNQARDVIKIAVLPLSAASPEVTVEMVVRAEGGMSGIPRETLNLVVLEGLHQLGLHEVDVSIPQEK
jgi:hypothetical protein